ncbi:hypothetical protein BGZ65_009408, partial [Modicella reniformis]
MSQTPFQEFRTRDSSDVVAIPTRYDPKTKGFIMRWKDIQHHFENAKRVMNGKSGILFLTDDDLEDLQPLRISHYPDVVLEVVVTDHVPVSPSSTRTSGSTMEIKPSSSARGQARDEVTRSNQTPGGGQIYVASSGNEIGSMSSDVAAFRISEIEKDNRALMVRFQDFLSDNRTSLITPRQHRVAQDQGYPQLSKNQSINGNVDSNRSEGEQLRQLQVQVDKSLQEMYQMNQKMHQQQLQIDNLLQKTQQTHQQTDDIIQKMHQTDQRTHQLQQQITDIQESSQQMDQQTHQHQQQMDNILQQIQEGHQMLQQIHKTDRSKRQQENPSVEQIRKADQCLQETLWLQRLEFDRLMVIRSHVQALLSSTFLEIPIPRLFIVLPTPTGLVDKDGKPSPLQFRLYYLCECGSHTMNWKSNGLHEIHMAEHPGYDVDNHDAFFDKYGSYLLTMMYMVKYGAVAGGRAVPPLSSLDIAGRTDAGQGHLNYIKDNIHRFVDDTITHLEDIIRTKNCNMDPSLNWKLNLLEFDDIISHLKVKEDGN